jgi:uncharacterized membrane protein
MLGALLTNTIAVPELLWTIFCSFALYYAVRVTRRARRALQALREAGINSNREYAAITTILFYATVSFVLFMFTFIGIAVMFVPSSNDRIQPITWLVTGVFIAGAAALALALYMNERRREGLEKRIEKHLLDADAKDHPLRRNGD